MSDVFIHMGFPKTGSKTLQHHFFSKHPEIYFLGWPYKDDNICMAMEKDLTLKTPVEYDAAYVKNTILDSMKENNNKKVFLSQEEFSSTPPLEVTIDRTIIASRLKSIFGNPKIIICVRNQSSYIQSLYSEFVKGGLYIDFNKFLEYAFVRFDSSFFPVLKYYEYIKFCEGIFGKENIFVYSFEEFKENPQNIFNGICDFAGISSIAYTQENENKGLSTPSIFVKRWLNRLIKHEYGRPNYFPGVRPPGGKGSRLDFRNIFKQGTILVFDRIDNALKLKPYKAPYSIKWEQEFKNIYSESNKKLNDEFNLNLKKYNYPMQPHSVI